MFSRFNLEHCGAAWPLVLLLEEGLDNKVKAVVYGHTHKQPHCPAHSSRDAAKVVEQVLFIDYVESGGKCHIENVSLQLIFI